MPRGPLIGRIENRQFQTAFAHAESGSRVALVAVAAHQPELASGIGNHVAASKPVSRSGTLWRNDDAGPLLIDQQGGQRPQAIELLSGECVHGARGSTCCSVRRIIVRVGILVPTLRVGTQGSAAPRPDSSMSEPIIGCGKR